MRERILIAATILTSGWLGACSKPTSSNGQDIGAKSEKSTRQIELVEPARPEGAVVSDADGVVTDTGADCAEALPGASRAATVKEYVVLAESPVIDTVVLVGEAASVPSRYTR